MQPSILGVMPTTSPWDTFTALFKQISALTGSAMPSRARLDQYQWEIDNVIGGRGHVALLQRGPSALEVRATSVVGHLFMAYAAGILGAGMMPEWPLIDHALHDRATSDAARETATTLSVVDIILRRNSVRAAERVRAAIDVLDAVENRR